MKKLFLLFFLFISIPAFAVGPLVVNGKTNIPEENKKFIFTPQWSASRLVISGTNALNTGTWQRQGSDMVIQVYGHCGSTGGGIAGVLIMFIPVRLHIDLADFEGVTSNTSINFGTFMFFDTVYENVYVKPNNISGLVDTVSFTEYDTSSTNYQATNVPVNCRFNGNARIPILEWRGL